MVDSRSTRRLPDLLADLQFPVDLVADLHERLARCLQGNLAWLAADHRRLIMSDSKAWPAIDLAHRGGPVRMKDRAVSSLVKRFWSGRASSPEVDAAMASAFWIGMIAQGAAGRRLGLISRFAGVELPPDRCWYGNDLADVEKGIV